MSTSITKEQFVASLDRRHFIKSMFKCGMAASSTKLWANPLHAAAMASAGNGSNYKAIVLVTLAGGNDGNNMVVPMDTHQYSSYAAIRGGIAIPQSQLLPLATTGNQLPYGLHPALRNVASLYNSGNAVVIANVGPLPRPATKSAIQASPNEFAGVRESHPDGIAQWESAQVVNTGWGGRMADYLKSQSGAVPPVLSAANSIFDVGKSVQAVAIQNGAEFSALPPELNSIIANVALAEQASPNLLVQQAALFRSKAVAYQQVLNQAASYATLNTRFGTSQLSQGFQSVARIMAGRSVTGASRQIFYLQHRGYDHHTSQISQQNAMLSDFDASLASFFAALTEIGLQDQVLVVTHSDFGRTLQPNTNGGTDHGWGNHQLIIGGGITGGRIIGAMPDMSLGTSQDWNGIGMWIPTQSVVQMTAGVAKWMGLSSPQVTDIFPDLANFAAGAIQLI